MNSLSRSTWRAAVIGRWMARISGTLMVLFFLAFVIGEGFPPLTRMTAQERLPFLGLGMLLGGLILAWFQEGWGGAISVAGWGSFAIFSREVPRDIPLLIPAAAGVMHMACWWRLRGPAPSSEPVNPTTKARLRILFTCLWATLAVFVLLCANEAFGQPPLMTPTFRPPPQMVGSWHANLTTVSRQPLPNDIVVVFNINPDGSVSGTVGDAALKNGEILFNRSWFGRLINWRTDYLIRGNLSQVVESYGGTAGDRFSAPLNRRGSELVGSLFLSRPGAPKPLGLNLRKQVTSTGW